MSGFASGESSGTGSLISVIYFNIYKELMGKKIEPNLGNSRAPVLNEQGGILNLTPIL